MAELTPVTEAEFNEKVINAETPALVEFGAPWCGPCKMLAPVLAELAADYDGQAAFYSVDVDQNTRLVMQYGVMSVPTLILFRDGEPVRRVTGVKPKAVLEKKLFKN